MYLSVNLYNLLCVLRSNLFEQQHESIHFWCDHGLVGVIQLTKAYYPGVAAIDGVRFGRHLDTDDGVVSSFV